MIDSTRQTASRCMIDGHHWDLGYIHDIPAGIIELNDMFSPNIQRRTTELYREQFNSDMFTF